MLEDANQQTRNLQKKIQLREAEISKLSDQRDQLKSLNKQTEERLFQTRRQLDEAKLALSNTQSQLGDTRMQLRQTSARLARTEELMRQEKENAPIGRQLKAVGAELARQREAGRGGVGLAFKYLLYGLAWIPEKILAGTMFYLKNGGKETLKQILRRVRRG